MTTPEMSVRRLRQCALPDPYDEREVWCAKELTWAADRIEELEAEIKELRGDLNIANLRLKASSGEKA